MGPGQEFVVQHATGHGGDSLWVLLHGSNESWLSHRNFNTMVREYIKDAPAGSNKASHPRHQRYHGTRDLGGFNRQEATLLADWYGAALPCAILQATARTLRSKKSGNIFRVGIVLD